MTARRGGGKKAAQAGQEPQVGPVVLDGGTGRRTVPQDKQPAERVGPVVLPGQVEQEKDGT